MDCPDAAAARQECSKEWGRGPRQNRGLSGVRLGIPYGAGWTERALMDAIRRGPKEVHSIAEAENDADFGVVQEGGILGGGFLTEQWLEWRSFRALWGRWNREAVDGAAQRAKPTQ